MSMAQPLRGTKARRERIQQPVQRVCLTCDKPFTAEGRFNRLCNACKHSTVFKGQDENIRG